MDKCNQTRLEPRTGALTVQEERFANTVGGESAVTEQPVLIRLASEQDLEALHALDAKIFDALAYPFFTLRQLMDVHARHCLLADDGAGLIGYCLGAVAAASEVGWLLGVGVVAERRGNGVGRELMRETLRRMGADGATKVHLAVEPDNRPAVNLYESLGFRRLDYVSDYYGPRADRLIMSVSVGG